MYYAESGTDKHIRENFFPDMNENKVMIEVGAGPTEYFSMSKHFRDNGWRCICVEPNPKFVQQHKSLGHEIYQYACSNENKQGSFTIVNTPTWHKPENDGCSLSAINPRYGVPGNVKTEVIPMEIIRLEKLLEELKIEKIDLLSVDTEGWEIEVLQGANLEKYSPTVIVIEEMSDFSVYHKYLSDWGYKHHSSVGHNKIFIK